MRRAAPILIVVIGALALFLDFWPNVRVPAFGDTTGTAEARKLEWKLGLDLQGGFRVEYQAQPEGNKVPDAGACSKAPASAAVSAASCSRRSAR